MFVKLVTDKYSTQVVSVQLTWAWFVTGIGFVVNKITTIRRNTFIDVCNILNFYPICTCIYAFYKRNTGIYM